MIYNVTCSECGATVTAPEGWETHQHGSVRTWFGSWPPTSQPAILLRDTPEDRNELAFAVDKADGFPKRDGNIKWEKADAILAALRGKR